MSRLTTCVVGTVLAIGGYVAGVATAPAKVLPAAEAGAYWDASREAYVTGDVENLCFWKVDPATQKVTEATYHQIVHDRVQQADGTWSTDWDNGFVVTGKAKVDPNRAPVNREGAVEPPRFVAPPAPPPDKPKPDEG